MKKIAFLIFASAIFFSSCKTTNSSAENAAQNFSDAGEIFQADESAISDSQNEEMEISDSEIPENEIPESQDDEAEISDSQIPENEVENAQIEAAEIEDLAEKIPQDEIDELEGLLEQGEIPPSEIADSDVEIEDVSEEIDAATELAEAEIPAQIEDDSQTEELALPLLEEEILATDFPAGDENLSQEKISEEPQQAMSDLSEKYDFQGEKNSDLEEANSESANPENEDAAVEVAENEIVVPSRTMSLKRNQFVDIIYPGSGWIYLGEVNGSEHFTFYGRTFDDEDCVFTLRSKKAGNAILHFYKNDALTGNYIDDYIAIEIGDVNALDSSHVIAPSYAQAVPKKFERENLARESSDEKTEVASIDEGTVSQDSGVDEKTVPNAGFEKKLDESPPAPAKTENRPTERVQTAIQDSRSESKDDASLTSIAASENSVGMKEDKNVSSSQQKDGNAAQDFLRRAQTAYDEKRYADALSLLKSFFEVATSDFDAGFYLQGLVLEAQSEVRDIKSAIGSYDTVVKNFPQSKFWTRANERGIYLKRFYINIR
ncbi:MAG: hypothetical protein K2N58_10545 [Treponemataceae bacterium]|nr:hypothetical protein [Treponemataceae bacterium]